MTGKRKSRSKVMQIMHRPDVESGPPKSTSSSYGSLDHSAKAEGSSSSNHSGGLSMHIQDQTVKRDRALSTHSATSAADNASNGDTADATAATFGSDDFPDSNGTANEDDHDRQHAHPAHQEHLIKTRQYYRDMVLGVNDGLVSTFLLVAGVVGGGMETSSVLLTAVSGAIAGAISMFAGEYVATKSQNEVMEGEIKLEHDHIQRYHAEEMEELTNLLSLIGIPGSQPHLCNNERTSRTAREARKLRRRMTRYYASNPDALLKIMIALEFGVIDEEVRSPFVAGATSLALFFVGALPSTIPFAFIDDATMGLVAAGLACAIGLFIVGAVKTWATRGNMWLAAMENLLITAAGGAVAYGIGVGFQALVGEDEVPLT